ncbi:thiosulfate sulfurtransferase 16, chloroplastic [Selaginella moellendorffii]|uniref:thiosulfate sulfurtransferase 16, chloroplastic n=1 Tax=Selaginella moellendorffii TaxID=88036 RepID=UPI000D1CD530|nr:thiosulfate sulfurtransferase 16, chloroplastic [Selaginella moellendorffii]|eukprot:XP_024522262.1 thiosulfate sulfurtransferase 16, chloroplastic [Selaginella moellendorffii]
MELCAPLALASFVAAPRARILSGNLRSTPKFRIAIAMSDQGPRDVSLKHVEVDAARGMLQSGSHRYLDVRAPEVFATGNVAGSRNVPYYIPGSDKVKNTNFEQEVLSNFDKEEGIIVGCGTGTRSVLAAADLLAAGFTNVYNMAGGYRAIKNKQTDNK